MTRSLGRCYADRQLIRIARFVLEESEDLFREVLCHEAAHVAANHLHGRSIRPHGRQWKALLQQAGYPPSARYKDPALAKRPKPRTPRKRRKKTLLETLSAEIAHQIRALAFSKRSP